MVPDSLDLERSRQRRRLLVGTSRRSEQDKSPEDHSLSIDSLPRFSDFHQNDMSDGQSDHSAEKTQDMLSSPPLANEEGPEGLEGALQELGAMSGAPINLEDLANTSPLTARRAFSVRDKRELVEQMRIQEQAEGFDSQGNVVYRARRALSAMPPRRDSDLFAMPMPDLAPPPTKTGIITTGHGDATQLVNDPSQLDNSEPSSNQSQTQRVTDSHVFVNQLNDKIQLVNDRKQFVNVNDSTTQLVNDATQLVNEGTNEAAQLNDATQLVNEASQMVRSNEASGNSQSPSLPVLNSRKRKANSPLTSQDLHMPDSPGLQAESDVQVAATPVAVNERPDEDVVHSDMPSDLDLVHSETNNSQADIPSTSPDMSIGIKRKRVVKEESEDEDNDDIEGKETVATEMVTKKTFVWFRWQQSMYPALFDPLAKGDTDLPILFGDGQGTTIQADDCMYSLDLRLGDRVKVEHKKLRRLNYTVKALLKNARKVPKPDKELASAAGFFFNVATVEGYSHVTLEATSSNTTISVPISMVYVTAQQWKAMCKDRGQMKSLLHTVPEHSPATFLQSLSHAQTTPLNSPRTSPAPPAAFPASPRRQLNDIPRSPHSSSLSPNGRRTKDEIFSGCVFALAGFEEAGGLRRQLERHGGTVVSTSFSELFIQDWTARSLVWSGSGSLRFAAVIAKRITTSSKYIEALALGWPCMPHRFIQDCLEHGRLLPEWPRYLMAAGTSDLYDCPLSYDVSLFHKNWKNRLSLKEQFLRRIRILSPVPTVHVAGLDNVASLKFVLLVMSPGAIVEGSLSQIKGVAEPDVVRLDVSRNDKLFIDGVCTRKWLIHCAVHRSIVPVA